MKVTLAYGHTGLEVNLPQQAEIVRPRFTAGFEDETAAIRAALRNPISSQPLVEVVKGIRKVLISHSDITRPTPNDRLLPVLLTELESAGVKCEDITLLNALGTHRPQTDTELRTLLGNEIVEKYHCVQHDAFNDSDLVSLGTTSFGHPVRLNRLLIESDLRILTGFIEPHFFAGFSGGPKGVLPALAGFESVQTNHSFAMVGHPKATWGVTAGNPIWEEMCEMALRASPTFLLNVSLNTKRQITGVFAGDLLAAHAAGCEFVRQHAMVPVNEPYDIVLTTNSGFPLDINLYQCIKGISAANKVVRPGGAILLAGACQDGLPEHGGYARLLAQAGSPTAVLKMLSQPGFCAHDQWTVQVQAMIQQNTHVFVYSNGLTDAQIRSALFEPCHDIEDTIDQLIQKYGPRLCVLPDGPQTVPYYDLLR